MTEESTGQWIECVVDKDYEIFDQYPYTIRRKGSDKVINGWIDRTTGYVHCKLNGQKYKKHQIIALQFIPNPNNLTQVDHINRNRADNRIENLRWVSSSENQKNRSSTKNITHEFFDEIPCENIDDIIEVRDYGSHQFEGLYYCNNWFYQWNGICYRRLHINYDKLGYAMICTQDNERNKCKICYGKFKRLYGIE